MTVQTIAKDHVIYAMSSEYEPVLRVTDGSTVEIETCDCFEDQIQSSHQDFGTLDWDRINPATGPLYIDGAEPGDLLAVHIDEIQLAHQGVMTTGPGLGVFGDELVANVIRTVPVREGVVTFSDDISFPVQPMIGVIGTAPRDGMMPCGTPGDHGGNMDCKRITQGATLMLPVNVPGALFALGDVHAAMGDGEVAVCGVEIGARVRVTLNVIKGKSWPSPMVFDDERVITISSAVQLEDATTRCVKQMGHLLEDECGFDKAKAAFLMSAIGNLRVCQVVDPLKTTRFEFPRKMAEQLGFTFSL